MAALTLALAFVFTRPALSTANPYPSADQSLAPRNDYKSAAQATLSNTVNAMGGADILAQIQGIQMQDSQIYRSTTLTQSYSLAHTDTFLATHGTQTISFAFTPDAHLQQRIDREYDLSEYWIWALPALDTPQTFSLIVRDGPDSFAYFANGSNSLWLDPTTPLGYADPGLTSVLMKEARMMNPLLVWRMLASNVTTVAMADVGDGHGTLLPSVYDAQLDHTVFFDNATALPRFVRRCELNNVFGPSVSDLYLSEYRTVSVPGAARNATVMLPHRYQTVYNYDAVLEDARFDTIIVNPVFAPDRFSATTNTTITNPNKTAPGIDPGYGEAEISSFYHAALWPGTFTGMLDMVIATHPVPDMPQLWRLAFSDSNGEGVEGGVPDYAQVVVEFEDGVLVSDAVAHQSEIFFQWIDKNIGKPVKYVWPSHHHHDHAYGAVDYVKRGATMVVPEVATKYWSHLPNAMFETYTEGNPFVKKDENVQVRGVWHPDAPHAEDWAYLVVTKACPAENDTVVLFEADVWSPGSDDRWDFGLAREWLQSLVEDGVSVNNTLVVGAHGGNDMLKTLVDTTGFIYPDRELKDWKVGGPLC